MFFNASNGHKTRCFLISPLIVLKVTTTRSSHIISLGNNLTEEIEIISYNVTQLRMDPNFIRWETRYVSPHLNNFFAVLAIVLFPLSDIMWTGFACSSPVSSPLFSWFYSMGKSSGQSGSLWFSLSSVGVCLGKPWPAKRIFASKKTLKNPKEKNKTWKYLDVFFFQIWQQCKI